MRGSLPLAWNGAKIRTPPPPPQLPLASPGLSGGCQERRWLSQSQTPPLCLTWGRLCGSSVCAPVVASKDLLGEHPAGLPPGQGCASTPKGFWGIPKGVATRAVKIWCVWATQFHISCLEPREGQVREPHAVQGSCLSAFPTLCPQGGSSQIPWLRVPFCLPHQAPRGDHFGPPLVWPGERCSTNMSG